MASTRSPSPLSTRNCRNSETNSTTRRSFSGNPFARPITPTNPRTLNPPTPTDLSKRNSIGRKSVGNLTFQDGKENHKDVTRSPSTKNFMSPTISASSKFTPSPRKKILGEKNDVTRTSIQFLDKDFDSKSEPTVVDQPTNIDQGLQESTILERKVVFETPLVHEVTEDSVIRPFCCSPQTSPITAPLDSHISLPPYDPKKNFLSPRPQFLRYKPNPRIEILLNKANENDGYGEEDVPRLEESFNLSENSSDTEEEEVEKEVESEEAEKEVELDENKSDFEVKKPMKSRVLTRSKIVSLFSLMFLVACFLVSFTELSPIDLPIYEDLNFPEMYHESLRFASIAKESFDDLVEKVTTNLNSYFGSTHTSIKFFNLTTSPILEDYIFNTQIRNDFIDDIRSEEIQEFEVEEEAYEEMEAYEEIEEQYENQTDDGFLEPTWNPEDELSEIAKPEMVVNGLDDIPVAADEVLIEEQTNDVSKPEAKPEIVINDLEIEPTIPVSETLSSLTTIHTVYLAGFSMLIVAFSTIFYMIKKKSSATSAIVHDIDTRSSESCSSGSSSVQKGFKKPRTTSNNKRESLASSSSDFSMGSPSYGSFTTFERIPIKHGDEVMLTPIRRSSRLMKNQVTSS